MVRSGEIVLNRLKQVGRGVSKRCPAICRGFVGKASRQKEARNGKDIVRCEARGQVGKRVSHWTC
jgi:hypothetical protein